jgi:protein-tyrosine-phosphatase
MGKKGFFFAYVENRGDFVGAFSAGSIAKVHDVIEAMKEKGINIIEKPQLIDRGLAQDTDILATAFSTARKIKLPMLENALESGLELAESLGIQGVRVEF